MSVKVLIALVAGLAIGIAVSMSGDARLASVVGWIEPIGTLWVNAIRMTVIPLVVGAIIVGVSSAPNVSTVGSLGGRAVVLFLVLLAGAAVFAVVLGPLAFSFLHIDAAAVDALRASAAEASTNAIQGAEKIQSLKQWLIDLVPVNPIKAAADGAMLPLIVFSLAFGIAVTRVRDKEAIIAVARGVTDASLTLVRWFLIAAPVGVFALSLAIAMKLGLAAAGAVLYYMAVVCVLCALFVGVLYLLTWLQGGREFIRFWAPAQIVAFSSRSSLVALPAMIESSAALQQPLVIRTFFLPLAVATFRVGAAINIPLGVLFLAHLYGVDLSAAQLVTIALTSILTTFSVPGIPGGSIIVMVPVLLAANLPVEGIGILLGVDTLPDMFRTMTNVSGDLTVASWLSGKPGGREGERAGEREGELASV